MSAENAIRAGYALPGPGASFSAPSYDYATLLGHVAKLKPCGENASLDDSLPRNGVLARQIALGDWGNDWLVFIFQEPLTYQGAQLSYCLIRARWNGCPIGSEFCPVFVLTDVDGALARKDHWTSSDFQFVGWAEIEIVAQPGSPPDAPQAALR